MTTVCKHCGNEVEWLEPGEWVFQDQKKNMWWVCLKRYEDNGRGPGTYPHEVDTVSIIAGLQLMRAEFG